MPEDASGGTAVLTQGGPHAVHMVTAGRCTSEYTAQGVPPMISIAGYENCGSNLRPTTFPNGSITDAITKPSPSSVGG